MKKLLSLAAAVAVVAVVGWLAFGRGGDDYVVYAKFSDAAGILKNYNVKVGQVAAGGIKGITLDKNDHAVVKMVMDKGAFPIGAGATAKVRPVNLLGEKYVDLDPGDLSKPLPSGTMIPLSRTGTPIELDDALNILDPDVRGAMRIIINEAGLSMAGRGADFNQTLTDLPPALDATHRVIAQINDENIQLKSLIVQGDRVLRTVSPKANDLGDLVSSAADALQTAAQRRQALGQTVQDAPQALAQLRTTLAKLQTASGQLSPAADDLRATSPQLAETLRRVPAFTQDAKATLKEIRSVSPQLSRLGRQSTPTLRVLRPTLARVSQFSSDVRPLVDSLDQGGSFKAFLGFINGWASVTSTGDGLSHVFRLNPNVDTKALTSLLSRVGGAQLPGSPTKQRRSKSKSTATPSAPAPSAAPSGTPNPRNPLKPLTDGLKPLTDGLNKTLKDVGGSVGGVVDGLTGTKGKGASRTPPESATGKLLNYLLGS